MRRAVRWVSGLALALVTLVYIANIPFYSGASVTPSLRWRMEHGRIALKHSTVEHEGTFYVAHNSEGLEWDIEVNTSRDGSWELVIPLWVFVLGCAGVFALTWRRRRAPDGGGAEERPAPSAGQTP